jgi:alpha-ketoglutarate-dependent taurine dioxygenase
MTNVKESCLFPDRGRVAVYEATEPRTSPVTWAMANAEMLRERLVEAGACLLRGFDVPDDSVFAAVVRVFDDELGEYTYGSTPRSKVGEVYTSTEYPASEIIPLHNEMSYTTSWPLRIWFHAAVAARVGGETPLADSHLVYSRVPAPVRERFERYGVRYVRNYRDGLGVPWREAFGTSDPSAVEAFCHERNIDFKWLDDGGLRTIETCQAVATHLDTGKPVWMNQAHLFHISNLAEQTRRALLDLMDEVDLPRNAYLGDGSPIAPADLEAIRLAYSEETLAFRWQTGDLLMVDNMAMAHGRASFEGPRKILVAMTASYDNLPALSSSELT